MVLSSPGYLTVESWLTCIPVLESIENLNLDLSYASLKDMSLYYMMTLLNKTIIFWNNNTRVNSLELDQASSVVLLLKKTLLKRDLFAVMGFFIWDLQEII